MDKPSAKILEGFPNPVMKEYILDISTSEFTSVCPKTGYPDFATLRIQYIPNMVCIELKSLKLYLYEYRNYGAFYEKVTNEIYADLLNFLDPLDLSLEASFTARGGITTRIFIHRRKVSHAESAP